MARPGNRSKQQREKAKAEAELQIRLQTDRLYAIEVKLRELEAQLKTLIPCIATLGKSLDELQRQTNSRFDLLTQQVYQGFRAMVESGQPDNPAQEIVVDYMKQQGFNVTSRPRTTTPEPDIEY